MCSTDYEYSTVWNVTTPKARKEHRCYECDLPIPVGSLHERVGSLYDGRWETYRTHLGCKALALFIEHEVCGDHGSILAGGLGEEIAYQDAETRDVLEWLWECARAPYETTGDRP